MEQLLIIEDCKLIREQLVCGLCNEYEVLQAANRLEAISLTREHNPKVVIIDLGLPPDENGTEEGFRCIDEILDIASLTRIIVITGQKEKVHARRAVKAGAYDFFSKPIDFSELKVILRRAFRLATIELECSLFQEENILTGVNPGNILGQSSQMQEVFSSVRKVAKSNVSVLVVGESGTGKELVARAIHGLSQKMHGPFVAINCGAIPDHLLESELFGHEKGAFSGAHCRIMGKFEYAHHGSLFLDEVGELPLSLQVKLLRFLQEKTFQRVGGREDLLVDARIIAATNRDIAGESCEGRFREDLFYRLSVIQIKLPPLRERTGDIFLLADYFLRRFGEAFGKRKLRFSSDVVKMLESHSWPGNVRELENVIQRAVIMSDSSRLEMDDFGFLLDTMEDDKSGGSRYTLRHAREKAEREMILSALVRNRHNMTKAAQTLGVSRPTMYDLARKHGIVRMVDGG